MLFISFMNDPSLLFNANIELERARTLLIITLIGLAEERKTYTHRMAHQCFKKKYSQVGRNGSSEHPGGTTA